MEDKPLLNEKKDPFAALRYREFRSFLGMRFFFTFAYQMQAIVIGIHLYYLTNDVMALAITALCEFIPSMCIALYGGYVADKSEKRKLLLSIFSGVLFATVMMLIVTSNKMHQYVPMSFTVPIMYGMIVVIGLARGLIGPATFSLLAAILPKSLYPNGSTWSSTFWQLATITGPAIGGLIYAFFGITVTYLIIVSFVFGSIVCIFFLKTHPAKFVPKESIFKSFAEGIRFVFKSKMMLGAMSLDLFSVFFGGAVMLLPVIAKDVLHVGPQGAGFMRAAAACGSVISMLVMTRFPPMNKPWRNLLIAVFGFGLCIIGYGLSTSFYLTLFFLFFEGVFDSVSVIIRSTIMQLLTPDEMRGRVSAVNSIFIGSSNELGNFESGITAKLMRTVPAVVFGGSMTLAIAIITYFKTKSLLPLTLSDIKPAEKIEDQI